MMGAAERVALAEGLSLRIVSSTLGSAGRDIRSASDKHGFRVTVHFALRTERRQRTNPDRVGDVAPAAGGRGDKSSDAREVIKQGENTSNGRGLERTMDEVPSSPAEHFKRPVLLPEKRWMTEPLTTEVWGALFTDIAGQESAAGLQSGTDDGDSYNIVDRSDLQDPVTVDSTFATTTTFKFVVGSGDAIRGLDRAVRHMECGQRALVHAHSNWAPIFGLHGHDNQVIELDVTLLSEEPRNEAAALSAAGAIKRAESLRNQGNDAYRKGEHHSAIRFYEEAMDALDTVPLGDITPGEADELMAARLPLHLNSAACHLKNDEPTRAIPQVELALEIDPQNIKAMWRLGQARLADGDAVSAYSQLLAAARLDPQNRAIRTDLQAAKDQVAATHDRQSAIFSGMFG